MVNRIIIRKKFLISSVVLLGLLTVYYKYFLKPLFQEVKEIGKELRANEERLIGLKDADNESVFITSHVRTLESRLEELEAIIPSVPGIPGIIADMEIFSETVGVELLGIDIDIKPVSEAAAQGVANCLEMPIQVHVIGNFKCILYFLEELENAHRMYNVSELYIFNPDTGRSKDLNLVIKLRTYALYETANSIKGIDSHGSAHMDFGRIDPFAAVVGF